jgi:hypothetical protein
MDAEKNKPDTDADAAAAAGAHNTNVQAEPDVGTYDPFGPLFEPTFGMDDF